MNTDYAGLVFVLGTLVFVLFALSIIGFLVVQKQRQYKYKIEKEKLEQEFQNQLLQSQIEVQEQAFQYFSEEIHDNVGQILSLAKLYLYKIAQKSEGTHIESDAREGTELLTKAISDLRNISHTANGNYVADTDLADSIKKELKYISSAKSIECNFETNGEPYQLGKERNLLVFRIIQESIANALKHGNPEKILITLTYAPMFFTVSVQDNGEGFDMEEKLQAGGGLGLNNMNIRANLLKGTLDITSARNEGTTIRLDIPV